MPSKFHPGDMVEYPAAGVVARVMAAEPGDSPMFLRVAVLASCDPRYPVNLITPLLRRDLILMCRFSPSED
jgi:hypothetical protein